MENLSLDSLNPKEAELIKIANDYKNLTINGVNDKQGYQVVSTARKHLAKIRVQITKDGKLLREEALAFQKKVIAREKELVAIIEPIELNLLAQEEKIDNEKTIIARQLLIPERRAKLIPLNILISDDELCLLDNKQFDEFYNAENAKYLAMKEEQLKKERQELEQKQLELERAAKIEADKIKAVEEAKQRAEEEAKRAAEQAKIEAENKMKKALEDAENKRLADIQALKDAEEKRKRAEEEAKKKADEEKKKAESTAKYKMFLDKNNYVNDGSFHIITEGRTAKLYKLVDQITL